MEIRVGDWIRFQYSGRLVIGTVEYVVPRGSWDSTPAAVTAEYGGQVRFEDVLEVRRLEVRRSRAEEV